MDALYITIKDDLVKLIECHVYKEGEEIPSEDKLAENYGVSRPTVRRAIQLLEEEGYVERRPYHGAVVCPLKINQGFTSVLRSFDAEMRANDCTPHTRVLFARGGRATAQVANRLEIAENAPIFKLVRLRYADDCPNVIVETHVPLGLYPEIASVDFETVSLYSYFESTGHPVVKAHRRLEIKTADANMAALLDIPVDDPVYCFATVARIEDGRVAEFTIANYRGRSNAFEFDTTSAEIEQMSIHASFHGE